MSPTEKRDIERVRYWQGQLLRSRDFNDIHAVEEQRRWWHNRALHNAYGIHHDRDTGPGFQVSANADNTAASVTAGLAYDCFGRELILENNQAVPFPPKTRGKHEFLLLVRYRMKAPDSLEDGPSAVCFTGAGPLTPGFVEFTWKPQDQCSFTDGVPLAVLTTQDGKASLKQLQDRPSSRPLARPQLGSGFTVPGNTAWELWTAGIEGQRLPQVYGVQTRIDTSASGFTDAPCYFAWLQGNLFSSQTRQIAPALFTSIAEESVNGFVFRIAFPVEQQFVPELRSAAIARRIQQITADQFPLFARQQNLYVNWVGCQENASAPFFFTFLLNPIILRNLNLLRFPQLFPNLNILKSDLIR